MSTINNEDVRENEDDENLVTEDIGKYRPSSKSLLTFDSNS